MKKWNYSYHHVQIVLMYPVFRQQSGRGQLFICNILCPSNFISIYVPNYVKIKWFQTWLLKFTLKIRFLCWAQSCILWNDFEICIYHCWYRNFRQLLASRRKTIFGAFTVRTFNLFTWWKLLIMIFFLRERDREIERDRDTSFSSGSDPLNWTKFKTKHRS